MFFFFFTLNEAFLSCWIRRSGWTWHNSEHWSLVLRRACVKITCLTCVSASEKKKKNTKRHVYLSHTYKTNTICPNLLCCGSQLHTQLYPDPHTPVLRCETGCLWLDSASPEGLHWHLQELNPSEVPPPAWSPVHTHTTRNIMNKPKHQLKLFSFSSVSCLAFTPIIMKCFEQLVMKYIKSSLPCTLDPFQHSILLS